MTIRALSTVATVGIRAYPTNLSVMNFFLIL